MFVSDIVQTELSNRYATIEYDISNTLHDVFSNLKGDKKNLTD